MTRDMTSAMTSSAMKLMMKGNGDLLMVAGSSLAALSQGLLKPMYQAAPNNHATTAATITASQFTAEKSMVSLPASVSLNSTPSPAYSQNRSVMERLFGDAVKQTARRWCV
jgi:hypothetical protein